MNTKLIDMKTRDRVGHVVDELLCTDSHRATLYVSEKYVISACRPQYCRKWSSRDTRIEVVVKIGEPNYLERAFIKTLKRAGEPFPVKKIQLKPPVVHRKKKARKKAKRK